MMRPVLKQLEQFWNDVLCGGRWDDPTSNLFQVHLQLPGRPELVLPPEGKPQLMVLYARRYERGFLAALAKRHLELIELPLQLDALLSLPVTLSEQPRKVLEVLRGALSVTAPLVHLGSIDAPFPGTPALSVTTHAESHANGAGGVTDTQAWRFELRAPLRLRVSLDSASEYGHETSTALDVFYPGGAPSLAPLLDAFKEQGLYASAKEAKLD